MAEAYGPRPQMPETELGRRAGILAIIAIAAGAVIPFFAPILVAPFGTVGAIIYVVLNAAATLLLIAAAIMGWVAIAARKDRSIVLLVVTIIATVLGVFSLPALF